MAAGLDALLTTLPRLVVGIALGWWMFKLVTMVPSIMACGRTLDRLAPQLACGRRSPLSFRPT